MTRWTVIILVGASVAAVLAVWAVWAALDAKARSPGLRFADQPPAIGAIDDPDGRWHGYRVRLCNGDLAAPLVYVAAEARLELADGNRFRARNGLGNPFHVRMGVPPGWSDSAQWLDKATLHAGECAAGWLIFGVTSPAAAQRILWHGLTLDMP